MTLEELNPPLLWQYFAQLTRIPRPSHQETAIQQFVFDEATRLGLEAEHDMAGNVIVRKSATPGKEHLPGVILQGHLDMVAQKNQDTPHNFATDPILAYVDGEWVRARGTTLGADNGIGVAAALAILASHDIAHGPIEALFTASEETGMDGAKGLESNKLHGSILLNLDYENLGDICIGCAGGVDATFSLPLAFVDAGTSPSYQLQIRGLRGGHSGIDIHKLRGNAIKILVRVLHALAQKYPIAIADLRGGDLRNAIPREAQGIFTTTVAHAELQTEVDNICTIIRRGLCAQDVDFSAMVTLSSTVAPRCWRQDTQTTVLAVVDACLNGVDRMCAVDRNVVETSTNMSKIACCGNELEIQCLIRSLDDDARDYLASRMRTLFTLANGKACFDNAYPGWKPVPGSALISLMTTVGESVLGYRPKVSIIHAGLECGILGEHYPHWQMVSFGPTIEMPHSPEERVNIASVTTFWQWLTAMLTQIEELS